MAMSNENRLRHVCIIGTSQSAHGGISGVIKLIDSEIKLSGYKFTHIVSHDDLGAFGKINIALKAIIQFTNALRGKRFDLVHLHTADGASFYRSIPFILLSRHYRIPIINHIHCASWVDFYRNAGKFKQSLIKNVYNKCTRIIALSPEWKSNLSEVYPETRICILGNCIPVRENDWSPKQSNRTVSFVSRIETIKGVDILPNIIEETAQKIPDIRFIIAGDGSKLNKLKDAIAQRGLSDHVVFTGWIDDSGKKILFELSSVFLLPSYGEGMPMCLLEAMGYSLPCITTPVGGIPQIVIDGINGFLCPPGNSAVFSQRIVSLLKDKQLYDRMVAGTKRVATAHSPSSFGRSLKDIYDDLINISEG